MPDSIGEGDDGRTSARKSKTGLGGRSHKTTVAAEQAAAKRHRLAALAELADATEFAPQGTGNRARN
jgi:hypothetical protein